MLTEADMRDYGDRDSDGELTHGLFGGGISVFEVGAGHVDTIFENEGAPVPEVAWPSLDQQDALLRQI